MSAPQENTPKSSRRNARPPKQNAQGTKATRSAMSETEVCILAPVAHDASFGDVKQRSKRRSQAHKKSINSHDDAIHSDGPAPRSVAHPDNVRATPIKQQAYAGPTFHQSPAASALPIPKYFLAKSLPNSSTVPTGTSLPDQAVGGKPDPTPPVSSDGPKRETTPLDFLFDAARKAQTTPGSGSPHQKHLSPAVGSPLSRSPARREGETQFPFEFDTAVVTPEESGSPFTTPYKERIEAVRSTRGTPDVGRQLEESERKAKAAALKDFLKNSSQNNGGQQDNPFNARPAPQNDMSYQQHGMRSHSNPSTPMRNGYTSNNSYQYFPPVPYMQNGMSPGPKPPGSNLRNIYSPELGRVPAELSTVHGSEEARISTARNGVPAHPQQLREYEYHYDIPSRPAIQVQEQGQHATPSAQQLEDDLRRMLKMDLTSRV